MAHADSFICTILHEAVSSCYDCLTGTVALVAHGVHSHKDDRTNSNNKWHIGSDTRTRARPHAHAHGAYGAIASEERE
jgi:hypothetical protein